MKIITYKPRNPIRTHNWFNFLDKKISDSKIDKLSDIAQFFVDWCWNYPLRKYKLDKKPYIKLDPWDTWSMDNTLAPIIYLMLIQLKKTKHGSPHVDDSDVPDYLKSTSAKPLTQNQIDTGFVDEFHHDRWDWVISEMIWAFGEYSRDWESQFYSGQHDIKWEELEDGNYRMYEGPNSTHKFDKIGYEKHYDRINNGIRLFAKYYGSLWD